MNMMRDFTAESIALERFLIFFEGVVTISVGIRLYFDFWKKNDIKIYSNRK